jgi:polar amino acid transport system substrate-binding protein
VKTYRWLFAVLAAVALLAAACAPVEDEVAPPPDDEEVPDEEVPDEEELDLVNPGTLTVCSDIPWEPFEFFDEEEGEYRGFDMDLMREAATGLGLDFDVVETPFDGIWLQPAAGTCDVVASAMTITEEREEEADFTDPYFDADQSLLIRVDDEDEIDTLDDLEGRTIGVQTGTTGADYAYDNAPDGAEIVEFDEEAAIILGLRAGEVDAVLQDFPANAHRAQENPDEFTVTETFPTGEQYGFAVRQGHDVLLEALNDQLQRMRDENVYEEIFVEYFGEAP